MLGLAEEVVKSHPEGISRAGYKQETAGQGEPQSGSDPLGAAQLHTEPKEKVPWNC